MNKKAVAVGALLAVAMIFILTMMILSNGWTGDEITPVPYGPEPDGLSWALFETYGPMMVLVSALLFGAIIAGAAIARGEKKEDDE